MLVRAISRRGFRSSVVLRAAGGGDGGGGESPKLRLNFMVPHQAIVKNKEVHQVTIPSPNGEFGVLAGHVPIIAELQPGVVTIDYGGGATPEKYFVSSGFAFVHSNSVTDISASEAVLLDELDVAAINTNLKQAEEELANAADDRAKAIAQIKIDVNKKMASAVASA